VNWIKRRGKDAINNNSKAEALEPLVVLSLFTFFVWLISTNANYINEDGRYVIGIGAIVVFSAVVAIAVLNGSHLGKRFEK
jgi:hypothetical protein